MIKSGMRVKDQISGFTGIAVARAEWLFGCDRIAIQEEAVDEKGDPKTEAYWFDEPQVKIVAKKTVFLKDEKPKETKKPGGPMSSTPKRRGGDPQRRETP